MAPGPAIFVPGCLPQQLYKISHSMDTICPSVDTKCPPIRVKASCVPSANKQNNDMNRSQMHPPVPQTSESAVSPVTKPASANLRGFPDFDHASLEGRPKVLAQHPAPETQLPHLRNLGNLWSFRAPTPCPSGVSWRPRGFALVWIIRSTLNPVCNRCNGFVTGCNR